MLVMLIYLQLLKKIKNKLLVLSLFILFSTPLGAVNIIANYEIVWNNVLLGEIEWQYNLNGSDYKFNIELRSAGIANKLYPFYGKYLSSGILDYNNFQVQYYSTTWKTKKKDRFIEIFFNKGRITSFKMEPNESGVSKIDFFKLNDATDPITASLELIINNEEQIINNVFDGRRIYNLLMINKNNNKYILKLDKYKNIWKDHNKTDLKKIEVTTGNFEDSIRLPLNFIIKNKRLVFKINYLNHILIN